MPIEIRELIVKVRIEEAGKTVLNELTIAEIKNSILRDCRREIKSQLRKSKQR